MWRWGRSVRSEVGHSWGGPLPTGPVVFHPLACTARAALERSAAEVAAVDGVVPHACPVATPGTVPPPRAA